MKVTPVNQKGMQAWQSARRDRCGGDGSARVFEERHRKERGLKERGYAGNDGGVKEAVMRVLTPHASAILLDPEYGLKAAKARAKNAGLLLAYENSGYDNTHPGRLPDLLDHWSVRRLVAAGADCIKILLYYTPFDSTEINETKHAWVERMGANVRQRTCRFSWSSSATKRAATKRDRVREEETGNGDEEHGGIFEAAIWRGRAEGGGAGEYGVRRGKTGLQGRVGLQSGPG